MTSAADDDSPPANRSSSRVARTLERIERFDEQIGAFRDTLTERAEREAAQADRERGTGFERGPLHGIPIGIKELFDVDGADNSYGSEVRAGLVAGRDAEIVERLRRAGAVIVGTTRSHEYGWGITTQHASRGSTRNPRDLSRTPGGSSGGSAAAVAAGFVPLAVGSDTGGSIRLPAAFCGVIGLKTTFGRISRRGGVALAPSFDSPGFLGRSASVLAAALAAVAGPSPDDSVTIGTPPFLPGVLDPMVVPTTRFAVPEALLPKGLSRTRSAALQSVVDALLALGAQRTDVAAPDAERLFDVFVPFQMAEAHHVHSRILGTFPGSAAAYGSDVRGRLEQAARVTVADYLDARAAASDARAQLLRALTVADVLVTPVGATGPSTIADPDVVMIDGVDIPLRTVMMPSTVAQNLAGLPSVTIPVGADEDGMPIGIQLTGAPWNEMSLLSLAWALELHGLVAVTVPDRFATD